MLEPTDENTLGFWKDHVGPGWQPILDSFAQLVADDVRHDKSPRVDIQQIKEKFGTLRIYFYGGNERTMAYVRMAEQMSARVCEECGREASTRSKNGWYKTLCEEHIA